MAKQAGAEITLADCRKRLEHERLMGNLDDYAQGLLEVCQSLQFLKGNPLTTAALSEFIQQFKAVDIFKNLPESEAADGAVASTQYSAYPVTALDLQFLADIDKQLKTETRIELRNILQLLKVACLGLNDFRVKNGTVYHQFRHLLEAMMDLYKLCSKFDDLCPSTLLMMLCGLFHDFVFDMKRIHDERNSAQALVDRLKPVLERCGSREILEAFIKVQILGASTPALMKPDAESNSSRYITNLYDLALAMIEPSENLTLVTELAKMFSHIDIQRTNIGELYKGNLDCYDRAAVWGPLTELFSGRNHDRLPSLKRKLGQGLRIATEPKVGPLPYPTVCAYALSIQQNPAQPVIDQAVIEAADIEAFAKALGDPGNPFCESNFALIMQNTCHRDSKYPVRYNFVSDWDQHSLTFSRVYEKLMTADLLLADKVLFVKQILHAGMLQDGMFITLDEIFGAVIKASAVVSPVLQGSVSTFGLPKEGDAAGDHRLESGGIAKKPRLD